MKTNNNRNTTIIILFLILFINKGQSLRSSCTIPTDHILHINDGTPHNGVTAITGTMTTDSAYELDGSNQFISFGALYLTYFFYFYYNYYL